MSTAKLGVSVVLIVLALVLASLAFATDHWHVWIVDRTSLRTEAVLTATNDTSRMETEPDYFTSYSGLLRTCYPGNDTATMLLNKVTVDENCFYVDYQLSEAEQYISTKSQEYWMVVHIRRFLFSLTALGITLLLLSLIAGTYGCWTVKTRGTTITALFLFLALVALGGSVGTTIGLNFLEKNVPEYSRSLLLEKHSLHMYSWSFYIQCCSTGLCLLAFLLVALVAYRLHREQTLAQRAAAKMRTYYDDLQRQNEDPTFPYHNRAPSPLQKAVTEQNGEKMVPILMFDNAGFDKGILY